MNAVSLFSGVGGLDLGVERAGFQVVAQCEADPYRRRVLERHWPGVHCFSDVREVGADWEQRARDLRGGDAGAGRAERPDSGIDLLFGGFPCQDLSVAGKRRGFAGERSSLFFEFARIADELVRPGGWVLVENVPGLLSGCSCQGCRDCGALLRLHSRGWGALGRGSRRDDGGRLFADGEAERPDGAKRPGRCPCGRCAEARRLLDEHNGTEFAVVRGIFGNLGFHDLAWRVLDSRYFGVPQRRRRIFLLARRARGRRAAEVLLEPESGGGNFEAGGKAGPRAAASLSRGSSSSGVSAPGRRQEDDENIVAPIVRRYGKGTDSDATDPLIVNALDRKGGGADDNDAQAGHLVAHTLRAEGFDASEDGTGRGTPLIPDGVRATPGTSPRMDLGAACALDLQPDGPRYAACGDAVTTFVAGWIAKRLYDHLQQYEREVVG